MDEPVRADKEIPETEKDIMPLHNQLPVICGILFVLFLVITVSLKFFQPRIYLDRDLGIEFVEPHGWSRSISLDKNTVTYTKSKSEVGLNSLIKFDTKLGNPYGSTPLDYMSNGILPQIKYTYELENQAKIHFREQPSKVILNQVEWASISFYINYEDLQIIYVTQRDDQIFILALNSKGPYQREDEEVFFRTLKSVKIYKQERINTLTPSP